MNNYNNPKQLRFVPITTVDQQRGTGTAGWVDTDVSAVIGTVSSRLYMVNAKVANLSEQIVGIRAHGEAVDNKVTAQNAIFITRVSTEGHVDVYRNATSAISYYFIGYFE